MNLGIDDIVPATLHRTVGWDMRHHFMAEKVIDRFGLQLPRDRELVRQLAVIYVLAGVRAPPTVDGNGKDIKALKTPAEAVSAA